MKESFFTVALPTWIMTALIYAGWSYYPKFTVCYLVSSVLVSLWNNEKKCYGKKD